MNEQNTNHVIVNQETPINRFKGKSHTLTREDRVKGGKVSSESKTKANRLKAIKHGGYSKAILKCNQCLYSKNCAFFVKDHGCQMEIDAIRDVMKIHTGGPESLFQEVNKTLQRLKLKILATNDEKALKEYVRLLFEYKSARYGDKYLSVSVDLSSYLSRLFNEEGRDSER